MSETATAEASTTTTSATSTQETPGAPPQAQPKKGKRQALKPATQQGKELKPLTPKERFLKDLHAAQAGDQEALRRALKEMEDNGIMDVAIESYTSHTVNVLTAQYGKNLLMAEMYRRKMLRETEELLAESPNPSPSALERLLNQSRGALSATLGKYGVQVSGGTGET